MFNILGEVFEEKSLKDLIIEAIRYGDQPEVRAPAYSSESITLLTTTTSRPCSNRNALAQESMTCRIGCSRSRRAWNALKLVDFSRVFVRSFFLKAFDTLGGTIHRREAERCEITHAFLLSSASETAGLRVATAASLSPSSADKEPHRLHN